MTTGEISSFESKHLRTKNRLPEYLVAPLSPEPDKYILIRLLF